MSDWDDDDFEVDVKQLKDRGVKVVKSEVGTKIEENETKNNSERNNQSALKTFTHDPNRELTEKEKEELQKRADFKLARELFGEEDDRLEYKELEGIEDFRKFGENIGNMLQARASAQHYSELLFSLFRAATATLEANKVRHISASMKTLADEKTAAEKVGKAKGSGIKPTIKVTAKAAPKSSKKELYEDYVIDEYDDFADDFM